MVRILSASGQMLKLRILDMEKANIVEWRGAYYITYETF